MLLSYYCYFDHLQNRLSVTHSVYQPTYYIVTTAYWYNRLGTLANLLLLLKRDKSKLLDLLEKSKKYLR